MTAPAAGQPAAAPGTGNPQQATPPANPTAADQPPQPPQPQPQQPLAGQDEPKPETGAEVDWKARARQWEERAKENKARLDELAEIKAKYEALAKVFNPDAGDDADPAEEAAKAQEEAWAAKVSLAVFRQAQAAGANPDRLLRDQLFYDQLDEHVTADPGEPGFDEQVRTAIEAAMAADPVFRAGPAIPPASGGPMPAAPGERPQRARSFADAFAKRNT